MENVNQDTVPSAFYQTVAVWRGRKWVSYLRGCVREWKNHELLPKEDPQPSREQKYRLFVGKWLRNSRQRLSPAKPHPVVHSERRPRSLAIEIGRANPAFNILVPSLRPEHIFGGITTAINLGRELSKLGKNVRLVTTDYPLPSKENASLREFLTADASMGAAPLKFSAADTFIATAWWSAHFINRALREHPFTNQNFIYLIQDFEPGFYSWGDQYALAEQTYRFSNFTPVFNTSFLANFFRDHGYLVGESPMVISPDVDPETFFPNSVEEMKKRVGRPRVLVYGRPSVERNLFSIALEGLKLWVANEKLDSQKIEIVSAGEFHAPVDVGRGVIIPSVGKLDYAVYPRWLRTFDIGLSLMHSPHPSYPPLEMAASGLVTVTNRFASKDLTSVSGNFISCDCNAESIAYQLAQAQLRVPQFEARVSQKELRFTESIHLRQAAIRVARLSSTPASSAE